MDDLVERVRDLVGMACDEESAWTLDAIAKAIIPIVYEDAAKVAEEDRRSDLAKDCDFMPEWQKNANRIAQAIRSRSMTIVGE